MADKTDRAGFPMENGTNAKTIKHALTLTTRTSMQIEGVTEVVSFDDCTVLLRTSCGDMTVEGTDLKIGSLDTVRGSVSVSGKINGIWYPENQPKRRRRLFSGE